MFTFMAQMFVGSFEGDFNQFQTDTAAAIKQFKASGVTHLLIDLTNNGGGFVCLGQFLHQFLAGKHKLRRLVIDMAH